MKEKLEEMKTAKNSAIRQLVAAGNLPMATHKKAELAEINAALDRIDAGTYGKCADCGDPIPAVRLEAVPTCTCCVECQTEIERIAA